MTTITITDDQGQLTVSVDGSEPMPVESAEQACQIVEKAFGQPDMDESGDGELPQEDAAAQEQQAFSGGFQDVRGGGLNG